MIRVSTAALAALAVCACTQPSESASTPEPPPSAAADPAAAPAPAPAPEPQTPQPAEAQASDDWKACAKVEDVDRLARLDDGWRQALKRARSEGFSAALDTYGPLLKRGGGLPAPFPGPGAYRCRKIQFGEKHTLSFVAYPYFKCEVELTPGGDLIVRKTTGSQRFSGKLYPDTDRRLVFLGAEALGDEPAAPAYGHNAERDRIGAFEKIGPDQFRLTLAWPPVVSVIEVLEVVK